MSDDAPSPILADFAALLREIESLSAIVRAVRARMEAEEARENVVPLILARAA